MTDEQKTAALTCWLLHTAHRIDEAASQMGRCAIFMRPVDHETLQEFMCASAIKSRLALLMPGWTSRMYGEPETLIARARVVMETAARDAARLMGEAHRTIGPLNTTMSVYERAERAHKDMKLCIEMEVASEVHKSLEAILNFPQEPRT